MDEQETKVVFHRADSLRQFQQQEDIRSSRIKEQAAFRVGDNLLSILASLKCDKPEVLSYTIDLSDSEKGYEGKVAFVLNAIHDGGIKRLEIPVLFKEGAPLIPENLIVEDLLKKADNGRVVTASLIKKELVDQYAPSSEMGIEKTASTACTHGSQYAHVLEVDKTWLPQDVKVGDLLYIDGAKYRVSSGDRKKLNTEGDGHMWTLNLVCETADPKEIAKKIIY